MKEVPFYHQLFNDKLKLEIDKGGRRNFVNEELNFLSRLFYNHILQLRSSLGLVNFIIPLRHWYIRNSGMEGPSYIFLNCVYSEMIKYITPFYEKAIEELKKRIKNIEPTFDNDEIINYFNIYPARDGVTGKEVPITFFTIHPAANEEKIHSYIEEILSINDNLIYSWFEENNKTRKSLI